MKTIRVIKPLTLAAGETVKLSEAQAALRADWLQPLAGEGVYRTTGTMQFKAGEVFGFEGELPKALAEFVKAAAKPAKAAAAAPG